MSPSPFLEALDAPGPAQDRAQGLQLYAFLIGSWSLDVRLPMPDGSSLRSRGARIQRIHKE